MEQLSTEEESSDSGGEGGSDDELARNLETLLGGRKSTRQLSHEQEELERQELHKLLDKPVSPHGEDGTRVSSANHAPRPSSTHMQVMKFNLHGFKGHCLHAHGGEPGENVFSSHGNECNSDTLSHHCLMCSLARVRVRIPEKLLEEVKSMPVELCIIHEILPSSHAS